MNQIFSNLGQLGKNLHVSIPVILAMGISLAEIWLPAKYADNLHKTERVLMGYGILAAANSAPQRPEYNPDPKPDDKKV